MKKLAQNDRHFRYGFFGLCAAIFAYLVAKATYMPFILDEATTFVEFVQTGLMWPGDSRWTTNNHFLNTGLEWIFYQLFGDSLFVLRLPNLLAFVLYSFALYSLMQRVKNGVLKIIFTLGMLAPLYMLDFFAMARGYGLSFAFLLAAAAAWLNSADGKKTYWWAEIALFLAVLANLSMIYVWPAFWLASFYRDVKCLHFSWKKAALFRVFSGLIILPHVAYALLLKANFKFDLGDTATIYESFFSHISIFFLNKEITAMWLLGIIFLVTVAAFFLQKKRGSVPQLFFVFMTVCTVAIYLFLYVILDAPLPINRVSLHLYLLWFPAAIYFVDQLNAVAKYVVATMLSVLLVFEIQDLVQNFSITKHKDFFWQREQMNTELIDALKMPEFKNKSISSNFFYRGNSQMQFLKDPAHFPFINTYNFPVQNADFIFVSDDEILRVPAHFSVFKKVEGFTIFRNTSPQNTAVVFHEQKRFSVPGRGFVLLSEMHINAPFVRADVQLAPESLPTSNFAILLCLEVKNAAGESVFWQAAPLNHYFLNFDGTSAHVTFLAENLPLENNLVSVYLWSHRMRELQKVEAEVTLHAPVSAKEIEEIFPESALKNAH